MASGQSIRNPVEWGWKSLARAVAVLGEAAASAGHTDAALEGQRPAVNRIALGDLRAALARGIEDFAAYRTDVIFLCVVYPLAGLLLGRLAFGSDMLPLLFPLASGFALVGPLAAIGLYEMSRRREAGEEEGWLDAFGVVTRPAIGSIIALGLILLAIFGIWLFAAWAIYEATLGPVPPASVEAFAADVFTTGAGWTMIAAGVGIGFLFAVLVLTISLVSFPILLERDIGVFPAILTSVRAVRANPGPVAVWGLIVAAALVLGSLPLLLGLVVVLPVLGHATWHLYRRLVPRAG